MPFQNCSSLNNRGQNNSLFHRLKLENWHKQILISIFIFFYFYRYFLSSWFCRTLSRNHDLISTACNIKTTVGRVSVRYKTQWGIFFRGHWPAFHARTQNSNLSNLLPYFAHRLFIFFLYSRWQIECRNKHGRNDRISFRQTKNLGLNVYFNRQFILVHRLNK